MIIFVIIIVVLTISQIQQQFTAASNTIVVSRTCSAHVSATLNLNTTLKELNVQDYNLCSQNVRLKSDLCPERICFVFVAAYSPRLLRSSFFFFFYFLYFGIIIRYKFRFLGHFILTSIRSISKNMLETTTDENVCHCLCLSLRGILHASSDFQIY